MQDHLGVFEKLEKGEKNGPLNLQPSNLHSNAYRLGVKVVMKKAKKNIVTKTMGQKSCDQKGSAKEKDKLRFEIGTKHLLAQPSTVLTKCGMWFVLAIYLLIKASLEKVFTYNLHVV